MSSVTVGVNHQAETSQYSYVPQLKIKVTALNEQDWKLNYALFCNINAAIARFHRNAQCISKRSDKSDYCRTIDIRWRA